MSKEKLSNHARLRNRERFGTSIKNVKEVMMYGYPPAYFEGAFRNFLDSVKSHNSNAVTVKVRGTMLVVYNKRSRRAITTYKVPEKYLPIETYLIDAYKKGG